MVQEKVRPKSEEEALAVAQDLTDHCESVARDLAEIRSREGGFERQVLSLDEGSRQEALKFLELSRSELENLLRALSEKSPTTGPEPPLPPTEPRLG